MIELLQLQPELSDYSEDEFVPIVISGEGKEIMEAVYQFTGPFPITLDDPGEISRLYEVQSYPTSFLVDREGNIVERMVGWGGASSLEAWRQKVSDTLQQ